MDHQKCKPSQSCCNQFTYQERIITVTKSPKGTLLPARRLKKKKFDQQTTTHIETKKCMFSERTSLLNAQRLLEP